VYASIRTIKDHFSDFVRRAGLGEEIIVTSHDRPVAKLVPVAPEDLDRTISRQAFLADLSALRDSLSGRCSGAPMSQAVIDLRRGARY
jgi:prevent-host-death family protein